MSGTIWTAGSTVVPTSGGTGNDWRKVSVQDGSVTLWNATPWSGAFNTGLPQTMEWQFWFPKGQNGAGFNAGNLVSLIMLLQGGLDLMMLVGPVNSVVDVADGGTVPASPNPSVTQYRVWKVDNANIAQISGGGGGSGFAAPSPAVRGYLLIDNDGPNAGICVDADSFGLIFHDDSGSIMSYLTGPLANA